MASSPPSSSVLGNIGQQVLSSPPPSAVIGAAAGAGGMNSLPGNATGASPITPPGSAAAAAAGGVAGAGFGLSSIRINPINTSSSSGRGLVAVAAGSVGVQRVSGVYRGTVVRGPGDVADELTIDNCIECHIYVLAPVK
jgi:hypothetical protein